MVFIKLLPAEQEICTSKTYCIPPSSFIVHYKTTETHSPNDRLRLIDFCFCRAKAVLLQNSWMIGRLKTHKIDGKDNVCLWYDETLDETALLEKSEDYLFHVDDDGLFELEGWDVIWKYMGKYLLKNSYDCLNKDEKLVKFGVIENTAKTHVAIFFSLNHAIGDGYTYHHLFTMMSPSETIEPMIIERIQNFEELVKENTCLTISRTSSDDVADNMALMRRCMALKVKKHGPPKYHMFKVNQSTVEKIKAEHNTDDFYVSTFDILSCWISSLCKLKGFGFEVDPRKIVPEITKKTAGYYWTYCSLDMQNITNPTQFRKRWQKIFAKEESADKLPAIWSQPWGMNLLSFENPMTTSGYTYVASMPVYDVTCAPKYLGVPLAAECEFMAFRLNTEEIAIIIVEHSDSELLSEKSLEASEMLDGKVMFAFNG